jgi:hypothetical protein
VAGSAGIGSTSVSADVAATGSAAIDSSSTGAGTASSADDAALQGAAGAGLSATVSVSRADLSDGAPSAGISAAAVISTDDLNAYARSTMSSDDNIQRVQASGDDVALSYKERAYFLGFIPASLTATAHADASGEVTVSYPWYGFLFRKPHDALQADLQTGVAASMNALVGSATAQGSLDAGEQAAMLDAMRSAMKQQHDADYGASAAASASASGSY